MSNKFKAGNSVKFIVPNERRNHWAISEDLVFGETYLIDYIDRDEDIYLKGKGYAHRPECFELATEAPNVTTTPNGLLPFNYEEAIKDLSRVVTRIGGGVQSLYKDDNLLNGYSLIAVINGCAYTYTLQGKFDKHRDAVDLDLFLKQPETVVYVNVYGNNGLGSNCYTLEEAIEARLSDALYVSKITITPTELKTETVHKY